jgi:hypothetical protein
VGVQDAPRRRADVVVALVETAAPLLRSIIVYYLCFSQSYAVCFGRLVKYWSIVA